MNCKKPHLGSLIIAGPCALESLQQLRECVRVLKEMDVVFVRASLWKPRTRPGWEGLGGIWIPHFLEETLPHGMVPATEIICAEHARMVVDALKHYGKHARMLVWLGSRNQNHIEQKKISEILASGPTGITFMLKNQMWDDERHWLGIYEHILAGGFPRERLLICHRGFSPGKVPNPKGYRNLPDFEMAMRVKEYTGLPMILDPSHIGGTQQNVFDVCMSAVNYNFDGCMVEVHCDPLRAKTDANQQLSAEQFRELLNYLRGPTREREFA